jgi:phospholipase C
VDSYASTGNGKYNPSEIMKCYSASQLPVLNTLAKEFVICDNWYSSIPGPTWPNRFFAHAASSGGLDHSPSPADTIAWETVNGFSFRNGTIYDRMNARNVPWRLYAGDHFPIVSGLKGINIGEVHEYSDFATDVAQPGYAASYTFIEPNYGHVIPTDFKCGTSQHPLDDVTRGEMLIKCTYDALRQSPLWGTSMLIITWDEHGGFFDHVPPPPAVTPGDTATDDDNNQTGFTFEQLGVRVPALVVSPLIRRNLIDHRIYDHASIPATVEAAFGLTPLTRRDAAAEQLMSLVTLSSPRRDTPPTLRSPFNSKVTGCDPVQCFANAPAAVSRSTTAKQAVPAFRALDSLDEGNLPGFLHAALRWDLALPHPNKEVPFSRDSEACGRSSMLPGISTRSNAGLRPAAHRAKGVC